MDYKPSPPNGNRYTPSESVLNHPFWKDSALFIHYFKEDRSHISMSEAYSYLFKNEVKKGYYSTRDADRDFIINSFIATVRWDYEQQVKESDHGTGSISSP